MPQKQQQVRKHTKDRGHTNTRTITIRITLEDYDRLDRMKDNNRSPQPHDTVGGYIKWLIATQAFRPR